MISKVYHPKKKTIRWRFVLPLLILWLAFGLRLYKIDSQSIWWDEGHSIFVASQPIAQIPTLPAMDVHPPAYFTLLHLWVAAAGRSEFALRYLSVIFSMLTVALLWRFARLISSSLSSNSLVAPLLASLLAALSPMYVAYGQEVRSYAMITFLALVSTFALWQIIFYPFPKEWGRAGELGGTQETSPLSSGSPKFRQTRFPGWLLLYIFSTAACLYTHYFTIFLLLFQDLVWLGWVLLPGQKDILTLETKVRRNSATSPIPTSFPKFLRVPTSSYIQTDRFSRFIIWLASQLGILLLFFPQLRLALRQVTSYTNPNLAPPSLAYFIDRNWQAYTVGLTIDPTPARWGMWGIAGVLAVAWLSQILARRAPSSFNFSFLIFNFLLLILWFLLPLVAYFLVLQRQPSFEPRYMMLITPALFLLLALGLSQASDVTPRVSPRSQTLSPRSQTLFGNAIALKTPFLLALYAIPLIIFLISLYSFYTNQTYFKDDSAGVADWLATETTANDIVYIDVPHPFHYYARQRNIPAPTRYLFVDIHTAADTLTREATGRDRLFWVTWSGSDTDPRGVIPFLAEKAVRLLGQQDFKGYHVEWFDLAGESQTTFSLPNTLIPIDATFGDVLQLDGMAFGGQQDSTTALAGEHVWATLHFTLLRETGLDYKVSLRLRGEDNQVVSQLDRDLLNDRHFRTSAWPLTDPALNQAINVYTLPLALDTPPGSYQLEVVVYNAEPPYPSEGVTGHENTDGTAAIIGRITVVP